MYSSWWGARPSLWIRVSFSSLALIKLVPEIDHRSDAVAAMAQEILKMPVGMHHKKTPTLLNAPMALLP
ncbi:MAG: hypothetical protein CL912_31735 [Deltaproteobacteria bacterium]|nr:hypothetical protein [Deltaproteobacteria bacterium]|tara:strand:+ start:558 stop:764 length:207 start_codon:yes stop_codon:yes gene_type:complete